MHRFVPQYVISGAGVQAAPLSSPSGFLPAQIRHAYGFDQVSFNGIQGDGTGQTIAIVDAYDNPYIEADLHQFDLQFGLPDPVFSRINQYGGLATPPGRADWALEIALDVEWAHAIAPGAKILLVEAMSDSDSDVFAAINTAARQPGVSVISMSFGDSEVSWEGSSLDGVFKTPTGQSGITYVAASGDNGAPPILPAISPNVLAVGGTTLSVDASNNWSSETTWNGSGGGISVYETQPYYQQGVVTQTSTMRSSPDVAYNGAGGANGVAVYDIYDYPGSPWIPVGGTSAGTPQWSALVAIANQGRNLAGRPALDGSTQTVSAIYQLPASDFHDITTGSSGGHPNYSAGPGYDLVTGRGTPIANRVVADLVSYGTASVPQFADPGFESPNVYNQPFGYQYAPSGSAWTFNGTAGLTDNGGIFTLNNPSAPQGIQAAFVQVTGSISQSITLPTGRYVLSFNAAQRGSFNTSSESIQVWVDGKSIGIITPTGTNYATYTTPAFNVAAGSHTVTFAGLDPNGRDNTALLDQVAVQLADTSQVSDGGFEAPGVVSFRYGAVGSAWTFDPMGAGLATNYGAFTSGNPPTPDGNQVAFLQGRGSFSQTVSFAPGAYFIAFSAAQRAGLNSSTQTLQVLVDGSALGTITPAGISYATYTTGWFTLSEGLHTITFAGLNPNGGDNTALVDQVSVQPAPLSTLADPGFEVPSVGGGSAAYQVAPSASPWTFAGTAGVTGNNSAYTLNNPDAPQGGQVAFLQTTGSASQTVGLAPGTYYMSFLAAQRGTSNASTQTFQVLVDGSVVGTFTPTGFAYGTYATQAFTVSAGMHTITFAGLNPNGGDNTALFDRVYLTQVALSQPLDPGFESPNLGTGSTAFQFAPTSSAWKFTTGAGLAANGSALTAANPGAPEGKQVAFLQGTGSSISQAVDFTAGSYIIGFAAAQRAHQAGSEAIQVYLDGVLLLNTIVPTESAYDTYVTIPFTVPTGKRTLSFVGLDRNGTSDMAFLDDMDIIALY